MLALGHHACNGRSARLVCVWQLYQDVPQLSVSACCETEHFRSRFMGQRSLVLFVHRDDHATKRENAFQK